MAGKKKSLPQPVSSKPLFDWFGSDRANRGKLRAAGLSDGQITNWKERGIPRAQLDSVASLMGMTTEQYLVAAGETPHVMRQPAGTYAALSEEALEIARAFDQMQPQAREYIREQVFIYTVIDKQFPWLRHGKPIGKTYDAFERWHQENIEAARDLELQRAGRSPSVVKK